MELNPSVSIPAWAFTPQRRRYICDDDFFLLGDMERGLCFKVLSKSSSSQVVPRGATTSSHQAAAGGGGGGGVVIQCTSGRCHHVFNSVSEYEEHYTSAHCNTCESCHRAFPTTRLLDLHILETHDSLFKLMAEKQKMVGSYSSSFSLFMFL